MWNSVLLVWSSFTVEVKYKYIYHFQLYIYMYVCMYIMLCSKFFYFSPLCFSFVRIRKRNLNKSCFILQICLIKMLYDRCQCCSHLTSLRDCYISIIVDTKWNAVRWYDGHMKSHKKLLVLVCNVYGKGKVMVNFTLEQSTKVQRGTRGIAVLFL